jgi:hypothetical protein
VPTERIPIEGLNETLRAFKRYGPDAAAELRTAAQKISAQAASQLQAAGRSSDRTSALAAGSVRARRDRVPVIVAGGASRAGRVFFGAEFGGQRRKTTQQFRPYRGKQGYWFYPALRAMTPKVLEEYGKALDRAARKWGAGG